LILPLKKEAMITMMKMVFLGNEEE